ncbi:unnamed protein product [Sphagnum jensenii]
MAPPSRVSSYYYELCDKTLVPGANLEEHKVGAIHQGLLEAFGKMTRCQLQVFREDLKTTYVKKQDRIEQMGDMLDSAMRQANVARRRKITAPLPGDSKNAPPRKEGRRQLDGVLHIKFSPASIEQCEGED